MISTCGSPTAPSPSALRCGLTWRQVYRQFGAHPDKASDKRTVPKLPAQGSARVKEDQVSLAGVELLDGSGRLDPASLDPGHRAAQSRSANKLISPFLTSQRPVSGLCAPGWDSRYLFPQACVIQRSFPVPKRIPPPPDSCTKADTPPPDSCTKADTLTCS